MTPYQANMYAKDLNGGQRAQSVPGGSGRQTGDEFYDEKWGGWVRVGRQYGATNGRR